MKRILAMILALMLVSAMTIGLVAYADEPVAEETPVETAETQEETDADVDVDLDSLMYYLVFDFADKENMTFSQLIYCEDEENLKKVAGQVGETAEYVEFDKKNMLNTGSTPVTLDDLAGMGADCFVEEGFFTTKYTFVALVGNIPEEATQYDDKQFLVFKLGKRAADTNGEKISEGAMMVFHSGKHCSLMATTYEFNWINILIALMVVVVIVLIVLIAVFSKKKKKLNSDEVPAEGTETVENAVEGMVEEITEVKEEIAEATEEIAEVIEEVKEETEKAEEAVEEIAEVAEEEKTEE